MGRVRRGPAAEPARARQMALPLVLMLVVIGILAGCAGGTASSARATPPALVAATAHAEQTASGAAPPATPTTGAVTTPGAQQGTAEFCAGPANVAAQLPPSLPAYPGGRLSLGQNSGGNGIYGICTSDAVSTVAEFYAGQLPTKGWQQVSTVTNAGVEQVQAARGNAHVVITVEPDAQLSGTTDAIILTSGA